MPWLRTTGFCRDKGQEVFDAMVENKGVFHATTKDEVACMMCRTKDKVLQCQDKG